MALVAAVVVAAGQAMLARTLAALESREVAAGQGKPLGADARRAAAANSPAAPGRIASHSKPAAGAVEAVVVAAVVVDPAVAGAAVVLRYSTFSLRLYCMFHLPAPPRQASFLSNAALSYHILLLLHTIKSTHRL